MDKTFGSLGPVQTRPPSASGSDLSPNSTQLGTALSLHLWFFLLKWKFFSFVKPQDLATFRNFLCTAADKKKITLK